MFVHDINTYIPYQYSKNSKFTVISLSCVSAMLLSYQFAEIFSVRKSLEESFLNSSKLSDETGSIQTSYSHLDFEFYIAMMISIQSIGNIIMSLINGKIVDNYGYQYSLILMTFYVLLGQSLIYSGIYQLNFYIIFVGRLCSYFSFVNIHVPLGKLIKKYFDGQDNQYPLINSIMVLFWVLGSILNSFIAPQICGAVGLDLAELVPLFVTIISSLTLLFLLIYDKIQDNNVPSEQLYNELVSNASFNLNGYKDILKDSAPLLAGIALIKGVQSIFLSLTPSMIFEYWGIVRDNQFYQQQIIDSSMVGIMWLTTFLMMLPFGFITNKFSNSLIDILIFSSSIHLIGVFLFMIIHPMYVMPILGIALSSRWALLAPLIARNFKNQFGEAFSLCIFGSEIVILVLSLTAGFIRNQYGSYVNFILLLMGINVLVIILHLISNKKQQN